MRATVPAQKDYVEYANTLMSRWAEGAVRQAWRVLGAGFIVFAVFLALSCLTYHAVDPSWNTASGDFVRNFMGRTGAVWADMVWQNIGLGILPILAVFAVEGRALWRQDGDRTPFWWGRAGFTVLAVLLAAAAGARLPSFDFVPQPYMGGAVGMMILNGVAGLAQGVFGPWVHLGVAIVSGFSAFIVTCLAIGLPLRAAIARLVMMGLVAYDLGALAVSYGVYAYQRWRNPEADVEEPQRPRRAPRRPRSDDEEDETINDDDIDDEDADEYAHRSRGTIKVVRPKTAKSRKKSRPKQMELGDEDADFELPDLDLLQDAPVVDDSDRIDEEALRKNAEMLQTVLGDYRVQGDIDSIHPGPVVTLYELEPAPGTKSSRVIGLANDIARSMSAVSVRAAVVPGRNAIGIEIPNKKRETVYLRELLTSDTYAGTTAKLALVLGKDIGGHPIIADLARMPHLLVAGTTGSGKSVAINTMILSLLYRLTPAQCRFIMIDPKMLELSAYDDIPHLLSPVVTEPGKAIVALKWAVIEMENRYRAMSKLGVRNIEGYNARLKEARENGEMLTRKVQTGFDPETGQPVYEEQPLDLTELPYIVIIVDEFADLMLVAGKDVESAIQRLAQMARAAGIHLIMATQRPSVDVITGVIKANFPTRISFQVTSKIDSRTILGDGGAEQLLGMGDMLYMAPGGRLTRVHGPFVSDDEVAQVVAHLREQGQPEYLDDVTEEGGAFAGGLFSEVEEAEAGSSVDEMYDQAVALVTREGKASTSFVQRHLQIGYNRAARIIEEMEAQGVISKANAMGKREVLVGDHSGRH
jgi:S-DNA-T family DNA segregation ATPase FtsK/SpoIIIE